MVSFLKKSHASSSRNILKVPSFAGSAISLRRPVQHIEQQRLQHFRRIAPSLEVEGLEVAERERVLGVVEEESILACAGPAVQPVLQLADDVGEIRDGALAGSSMYMRSMAFQSFCLFFEVQPVTLVAAFDQHAEEAEQELQILRRRGKRKRIDGEIARLAADVQIRSAEDARERFEAAADVEDEGLRLVFLCILDQEDTARNVLPDPVIPRISVCAYFAAMQVEIVGRVVVGFEHCQIFRAQGTRWSSRPAGS